MRNYSIAYITTLSQLLIYNYLAQHSYIYIQRNY